MKKRKEKTQLFTFGERICQTAEKATLYGLIVLFARRTFTSTILSSIHYLTEKPLHSVDNSCAKLSKGFERLFFFSTLAKTVSICLASQVLLLSQKQLKRYFLWKTDWMFFGKRKINRCKKQSFPSSSEQSSSSNLEKKKKEPNCWYIFFLIFENEPKDELCFAFKRLLFTLIKLSLENNYLSSSKPTFNSMTKTK